MYSFEIERILPQGLRQNVVLLIINRESGLVRRYELITAIDWTSDTLTENMLQQFFIQGKPSDLGSFLSARERSYSRWQMDVVREAYQTLLASGDVDQALGLMTAMFNSKPLKQQELAKLEQAIGGASQEKIDKLIVRFVYLALGLLAGRD